ncbi:unnamed protein product (macronuclear) [Paramecium tetraurelia]|uniref:EF-hand domain-containing protein n=1 Tax=Paramecium tetraurelia TaxID=5888 RepID=A0CEX4_PARTE|nr:uncharacterized protein GSPATT00037780001 [Paramecium tetraurelia]CAK69341.1 unnamed protein product [Paramecium tetraurelia]|eukprot:XP_001436738.1 hypothetical protein (macronuclear) [Paramecium tetraurelia strain d4-2]
MHNRNKTSKSQMQPLIQLSIDLGNSKCDRIVLYKETDPYLEARQFVQRNHLPQQMVKVISNCIIKQMKAYEDMMMITYDTQTETNYLRNLKSNHIELQAKQKTPSPQRFHPSPKIIHKQNLSRSPSNISLQDELPTDKVVVKKLFQVLDSDQDGLISANKVNYQKLPIQLKNRVNFISLIQISIHLEQSSIPFEFEELYDKLKNDPQEEYFITLKLISQILDIPKVKVLM